MNPPKPLPSSFWGESPRNPIPHFGVNPSKSSSFFWGGGVNPPNSTPSFFWGESLQIPSLFLLGCPPYFQTPPILGCPPQLPFSSRGSAGGGPGGARASGAVRKGTPPSLRPRLFIFFIFFYFFFPRFYGSASSSAPLIYGDAFARPPPPYVSPPPGTFLPDASRPRPRRSAGPPGGLRGGEGSGRPPRLDFWGGG